MTTVRLKGAVAQNWFAEQFFKDVGPVEALNRTCGPMHEAVKKVIAAAEIGKAMDAREGKKG